MHLCNQQRNCFALLKKCYFQNTTRKKLKMPNRESKGVHNSNPLLHQENGCSINQWGSLNFQREFKKQEYHFLKVLTWLGRLRSKLRIDHRILRLNWNYLIIQLSEVVLFISVQLQAYVPKSVRSRWLKSQSLNRKKILRELLFVVTFFLRFSVTNWAQLKWYNFISMS